MEFEDWLERYRLTSIARFMLNLSLYVRTEPGVAISVIEGIDIQRSILEQVLYQLTDLPIRVSVVDDGTYSHFNIHVNEHISNMSNGELQHLVGNIDERFPFIKTEYTILQSGEIV